MKFFLLLFLATSLRAEPSTGPVVVAALPSLNDYVHLASGGDDQGWRVGYDKAWVIQLPAVPAGPWQRAYVGAKLGRLKSAPVPGRPSWERRRPSGEVDVAVSWEPVWPHSRRALLARAEDLPLEGESSAGLEGVGEARWFWAEVSLKHLSTDRPHFIALFSPSSSLKDGHGPVLAGGPRRRDGKGANLWLKSDAQGEPPSGISDAFKTAVSSFDPAVAILLVPAGLEPPRVTLAPLSPEIPDRKVPLRFQASVAGADVARAWLESSVDGGPWSPAGRPLWGPPYDFTVPPAAIPAGETAYRVAAADRWETRGYSPEVSVAASDGAK